MQDDCLDVSNKPFYNRRKQLIPPPRGASFRTSKIMLMLTWRLYYGGAVITSITVVHQAANHLCYVRSMPVVRIVYIELRSPSPVGPVLIRLVSTSSIVSKCTPVPRLVGPAPNKTGTPGASQGVESEEEEASACHHQTS